MTEILESYTNGSYKIKLYSDGTKVREHEEGDNYIEFPESIDVKITNYCDLGCEWCHEQSTVNGQHADLDKLLQILQVLPRGVELAIGGGNPLSHPRLRWFLMEVKSRGWFANITINQKHITVYKELLQDLIIHDMVKGVGISLSGENLDVLKSLILLTNNIVYHLIVGVNEVEDVKRLVEINKKFGNHNTKILLLGYKTFGRGSYFADHNTDKIKKNILKFWRSIRNIFPVATLSFDNLAIEQLNVQRLFTKEGWEKFYMGDDFQFTMYIDAVAESFAPTSRSHNRTSFSKSGLIEYFTQTKKDI